MTLRLKAIIRPLAALLLLSFTWGCYGWHAIPPEAPNPGTSPSSHSQVRIETADSQVITLREATLTPDSVIGIRPDIDDRIALGWEDVRAIEVRRFEPVGTAIAAVFLGTIGFAVLGVWYAKTATS